MQKLHEHHSTRKTPQSEAIPGSGQAANSAGGFSWQVDDWTRLDRFLVLGTEGGSYYASEKKLTKGCAEAAQRCIDADGARTVARVTEISESGRAPKNDPALFVLAMATASKDKETRRAAWAALPRVARIGTHLFHFAEYRQAFGGWGRLARKAFGEWYTAKEADALAMQAVKYQSRDGWSHRDVLRLAHPCPQDSKQAAVFDWIVNGTEKGKKAKGHERRAYKQSSVPDLLQAFEDLKERADDPKKAAKLISMYGLPREAVPTQLLKEPVVWEALLDHMGTTALVRNLGNMSKCGLLSPLSKGEKTVISKLTDSETIRKSRIHPVQVLTALLTYKVGHGNKSDSTWNPCPRVVDALDDAFYAAFGNVEPTGKSLLLALDVSGSMGCGCIAGIEGLTPRVASAAMAMVTARVEKDWHVMGFSHELVDIPISPRQRLDDVVEMIAGIPMGGTDCSLPMRWAKEKKAKVDGFVVYTDNETWAGDIHPSQALVTYRRQLGINSKLVVVGMVANDFTIADPEDAGMLDVVGFDSAAPSLIQQFVAE